MRLMLGDHLVERSSFRTRPPATLSSKFTFYIFSLLASPGFLIEL